MVGISNSIFSSSLFVKVLFSAPIGDDLMFLALALGEGREGEREGGKGGGGREREGGREEGREGKNH